MKKLIDFDEQFNDYMQECADKLLNEGKKPEEIESLIPDMYEKWASEASTYFDGTDPEELVEMLGAYMDEEIGVPDILTDKISGMPDCETGVYELFMQDRSEEDKILLMSIMSDMGSEKPIDEYIRIVLRDEACELTEAATEALKYAGVQDKILAAYEEEYDTAVKEKLMYVLVYGEPACEGLAQKLSELLDETSAKAVVAGMIAYYGDAECLPALKRAEYSDAIDYIDYVEICDAIESLGGETKREREFNGDEYYEMVNNGGLE